MNTQNLPVIHFNTEFLEGDFQLGIVYPTERIISIQQFHAVRNAVLRVCRRFGTVGPVGEFQPSLDEDGVYEAAEGPIADYDPDFFVIDEMWNDVDKYIRVEPNGYHINLDLLTQTAQILKEHSEWAVGFGFEDGYLLVFAEKLMVKGERFRKCHDFASVAAACGL